MSRIEIGFDKISAAAFAGASLLFSVVPLGMLLTGYAPTTSLLGLFLAVSLIFFATCAIVFCVRLLSVGPSFVIDDIGFVDQSTYVGVGRVHWTDVVAIQSNHAGRKKFISVFVDDPESYISNARNRYVRYVLSLNFKWYRTPITIDAHALDIEFEVLERQLEAAYVAAKS